MEARPEQACAAMDIVLFWGAGQSRKDLNAVTMAARNAELRIRVVEVSNRACLSDQLKAELYHGGQLGPRTHVLAKFAVTGAPGQWGPSLALSESGKQEMPAFDFISWLRTPPPGMPHGPLPASWRGTVHAFWPHSGMLRDRFSPDRDGWTCGTMCTYSARKGQSDHNAVTTMLDLCEYLGGAKDEPALLTPEFVAARMLGVAGDTFTCFGGHFDQVIVAGAPRTPEEARQDWSLASLEGGKATKARIAGSGKDLQALASAMRHPRVIGEAARRQQIKLENVYAVRASRDKLRAMEALLAEHPRLRDFRIRIGVDGQTLYRRVATFQAIERAMHSLETGTGGMDALKRVLENIDMLCRLGLPFSLNLAAVIARRPHLVAAALRWAASHDHESLFTHLFQALPNVAKASLMRQCLGLALEHGPKLAMGLLVMQHPGMNFAGLMVSGLHAGASDTTVLTWMVELNWMEGDGTAAQVLEGLWQADRFFHLLPELARRFPGLFAHLLKAMRENPEKCEPYAEALLQHARQHQDTALRRQVSEGYFLLDEASEAQPEHMF